MTGAALNIASSGLNAFQTGLDTVSQNIANANTPGYIREQVNLNATVDPASGVGTGVQVSSIGQVSNQFQTNIELNAGSVQASAQQSQSVLSQIMTVFQEPSPTGISEQLAGFWSSLDQVANNPSQLAARQQVVASAQNISNTLNQGSTFLQGLSQSTQNAISGQVTSLNSMLATLGSLNGQIHAAGTQTDQTLIDQQSQILSQLSSMTGATVQQNSDGTVNVLLGGVMLVQGNLVNQVSLSGTGVPYSLTVSGVAAPATPTTGSLGAMFNAVNSQIPNYQQKLLGVAQSLNSVVNAQQAQGSYFLPGSTTPISATSMPFFNLTTVGTSGAFSIAVNPNIANTPTTPTATDPGLWGIAAAATPAPPAVAAPGDGSNAQAWAELSNLTTGPDALWSQASGGIGTDVANANSSLQAAQTNYQSAFQAVQAVSGVNVNNEMVSMVNYQQGYQAAAKVISTVTSNLQSLLAAV